MNHDCSSGSEAGRQVTPKRRSGSSEGGEPPRKCQRVAGTSRRPAPETDRWGQTLLHRAAENGDLRGVKKLLERGYDPLAQDKEGDTPLHRALRLRHRGVAELLAEGGNDIPGYEGSSPLHLAAWRGFHGVMRRLLAAGAERLLQNEDGDTPLHCALFHCSEPAAVILVDEVANDVQNKDGNTPLHLAARRGFFLIADELLQSGAHPHLKNNAGRYPLQVAFARGHDPVAWMIIPKCALRGISFDWEKMKLRPDQMRRCVELLSECEAEVRRLKEARIEGSRLSLHDVAERHPAWVAPHVRVEVIRRVPRNRRLMVDSFPHYGELIASKLGEIELRRLLLDRCLERFSLLFRRPMPAPCVDHVLLCFRDRDLNNLARAFDPDP